MNQYNEALKSYEKSLKIDPIRVVTWYYQAETLKKMNQFEKSLKSYDKAIELNPRDSLALAGRADVLANLRRFDEALKSYDDALKIEPNNSAIWHNRGNVLANLNRFSDALSSYEKSLEINSKDPLAWANRGNCLALLKRYDESLKSFDKALEIDNNDINALTYKALLLVDLNRFEGAESYFKRILFIDRENAAANWGMGFIKGFSKTQWEYKKLVKEYQKKLLENTMEIVTNTQTETNDLVKSFKKGLNLVKWMFIILFGIGVILLIGAICIGAYSIFYPQNVNLTLIFAASGCITTILSLLTLSPDKLQKNRVDFSQWMIAYFNWTNTVLAASMAFTKDALEEKPKDWEETVKIHEYLKNLSMETITIMENCCEYKVDNSSLFPKKEK